MKKIYIGFTQDKKTANPIYESFKEYAQAQVEPFITNAKNEYKEWLYGEETYSEIKTIIMKKAEEWITEDSDMTTCDEFGNIIDIYADTEETEEYIFADGSDAYDCDIKGYLEEIREKIKEIIK